MSDQHFSVDLDGAPHDCGSGTFALTRGTHDVRIGGKPFPVDQDTFVCSGCGEVRQTLTQLGDARRGAAKQARQRSGLLSPSEIRDIREKRLHVSQAGLENALGLGAKTVVRWETGKVLQPKATDDLLRILDKDPSLLLFLAEHHGVCLPAETLDSLPDASHTIAIPKRFLDDIQVIAAEQGVEPRDYAVWALAEHLSSEKARVLSATDEIDHTVAFRARQTKWQVGEFKLIRHTRRNDDAVGAVEMFGRALGGHTGEYAKLA